jgi:hypothetical protein
MHNMARCKLMGTCLWSCFGDFGRKSRLGSGILEQVCGDLLGIHSVVCEYQFGRAGWGKRRQLSWYDVLERVCGGLLGIRKVVCGYLLERVCWGTCRQLWWYEVVLRFSSGWT